jgi:hypothetical protein
MFSLSTGVVTNLRAVARTTFSTAWLLLIAAAAHGQEASITGVVKDASGGVLPGVMVEASSPALIEKTRTVVTDTTGQFRVVALPPGTYSLTFALNGFSAVKREGIEIAGSFTAVVNADMRVGAVQETVTVSGQSPIVDVQNTRQQSVLNHDVIDTVPAGRTLYNLAVLIPSVGISGANVQDVGGSGSVSATPTLTVHGSRGPDQKTLLNGVQNTAMGGSGWDTPFPYNPAAMQEVVVDTAGVSPELGVGGVRINFISRDGGNAFRGTFFGNYANSSFQGNNMSPELQAAGFNFPDSVKLNFDVNPGFGGPIRKDSIWFYSSGRYKGEDLYAANIYNNLNANNPNAWTYSRDLASRPFNGNRHKDGQLRLTWQATPKNKIGFLYHATDTCACPTQIGPTRAPDAANNRSWPNDRQVAGDWSLPLTSRVLFEVASLFYAGSAGALPNADLNPQMIGVTEQTTGLIYRTNDPNYRWRPYHLWHSKASMSYVTGAHAIKVGLNHTSGFNHFDRFANQPFTYRFNNGSPNQITEIAYPVSSEVDVDHDMGIFAMDKWTMARLTLNYGVRYSYFVTSAPVTTIGPSPLTPNRNITFPETAGVAWHDVTPHLGAAYDLFGSGKTALKVSLNKYLDSPDLDAGIPASMVPANGLVSTITRTWTDANVNFTPDCDLTNVALQDRRLSGGDFCGAVADPNFGTTVRLANFDPNMTRGWGNRGFNWEFSTGVQQQLTKTVAVNVEYFRRWYGNFVVTDNLAVSPSDFDLFGITAPADARLPGGGDYLVSGLYDLNPGKFGVAANNYTTLASNYGSQREHWNGVDITVNMRPTRGFSVQGGLSTGKTSTDNCDVVTKVDNPSPLYCQTETPFLTRETLRATYMIPHLDVLVAATYQGRTGPNILANYIAPNAQVVPALGRSLSGSAPNVTVNIVPPGTLFGERLNQVDFRFGKVFNVQRLRASVNLDLYNALNSNAVLQINNSFAVWQSPTTVLQPRFAKASVQLDF